MKPSSHAYHFIVASEAFSTDRSEPSLEHCAFDPLREGIIDGRKFL